MTKYIYTALACSLLAMAGCGNANDNSKNSTPPAADNAPGKQPLSKLNASGTEALSSLVNSYYSLKNALVATNAHDAQAAGGQLAAKATELQTMLAGDSVNRAAVAPYLDTIIMQSKAISAVTDSDCERYRLAFGTVSSALYGLMRSAGLKNSGAYREYCPMAFNEKGAYWLSLETEIKNPYFGKKMIECGEVTDTL